ncbi:MAG: nucleotidyltransferase family protein [Planctomycetota bacterium]
MKLYDPRPGPREALLLRAALFEGERARRAWRAWRADADLDRIDQASFRLLPLVYRNLERLGEADPWLGRLRGFYRRAWAENQILFRRLAAATERLRGHGIDTIVLKGAALAGPDYRDVGTRPMSDVDLLVRSADFVPAVDVLCAAGWHLDPYAAAWQGGLAGSYRRNRNAVGLMGPDDKLPALDLHHRLLHLFERHLVEFPEERLWAASVPFELGGVRTRRLGPEHALLHTAFHGLQRQGVGSIRWIVDIDRIVRGVGEAFRWALLIEDARRAAVLAPVREALELVARDYGTPVPLAVRRRLRRLPLAPVERLERAMRYGEPRFVATVARSAAPALRMMRARDVSRAPVVRHAGKVVERVLVRPPVRLVRRLGGRASPRG